MKINLNDIDEKSEWIKMAPRQGVSGSEKYCAVDVDALALYFAVLSLCLPNFVVIISEFLQHHNNNHLHHDWNIISRMGA